MGPRRFMTGLEPGAASMVQSAGFRDSGVNPLGALASMMASAVRRASVRPVSEGLAEPMPGNTAGPAT